MTQVVTDGPTVLGVQRFGYHWQPTSLVLAFNQSLNPITAQNPGAYQIIDPHGRAVGIVAAVYDPATQTVTLSLSRGSTSTSNTDSSSPAPGRTPSSALKRFPWTGKRPAGPAAIS